MSFKSIAAGLALAGLTASSYAVSYSTSLSSGSTSFGRSDITEASFTDVVTFTGLAAGTYYFESSITSFDGVTFTWVDLNGIEYDIIDGPIKLSVAFGSGFSDSWKLTIKATGDGFASYGGQISVTPIPEPESYALMLAGLGAIGFLVRRRREMV